jgi:cytosine/adenosine deaminase-related metal-dependent hydrolase
MTAQGSLLAKSFDKTLNLSWRESLGQMIARTAHTLRKHGTKRRTACDEHQGHLRRLVEQTGGQIMARFDFDSRVHEGEIEGSMLYRGEGVFDRVRRYKLTSERLETAGQSQPDPSFPLDDQNARPVKRR